MLDLNLTLNVRWLLNQYSNIKDLNLENGKCAVEFIHIITDIKI